MMIQSLGDNEVGYALKQSKVLPIVFVLKSGCATESIFLIEFLSKT